jgi:PilZ domain-containing protein
MSATSLDDSTVLKPPRLGERRALKPRRRLARIVPDRRRYRRVDVALSGRFMRANKEEYPCQAIQMSAGGVVLRAPVTCEEGERIVAYIQQVGRIEGVVVRPIEGGFVLGIMASAAKRERIINLLTWLINQSSLGLHDGRKHERTPPRIGTSKIVLPNGDVHSCRIIDVSLSGASVACAVKPPLDSVIVLGRLRGRVVRHHDQGVAIKFIELQDPDSIAKTFG